MEDAQIMLVVVDAERQGMEVTQSHTIREDWRVLARWLETKQQSDGGSEPRSSVQAPVIDKESGNVYVVGAE
ncbi:Thioredoxin domain-containing protein C21C3.12c [Fusarium oxysporum f. sp. albedinis]|nr:Thioredoxin domain-containing protein C21C3.12c [Fusarium oxysporum f. sp. albedinis]